MFKKCNMVMGFDFCVFFINIVLLFSFTPINVVSCIIPLPVYACIFAIIAVFFLFTVGTYNEGYLYRGYKNYLYFAFHIFIIICLSLLLSGVVGISITLYIYDFLVIFLLCLIFRITRNCFLFRKQRLPLHNARRIMIVGAGQAAKELIDDINRNMSNISILCLIDDDKRLLGKYINGIKVVGNRNSIVYYSGIFKIEQIILAIPSATSQQKKDILDICSMANCKLRSLPSRHEFIDPDVSVKLIRDVDLNDLLGRSVVKMDTVHLSYIENQCVLITGGGGSIGSELCRQIAKHNPKSLIIFDIYENNAYDIEQELKINYPAINVIVLIGSVRDKGRVFSVFEKYKPNIVYHAAAHKHVPLMEWSPHEAIKNNVGGTYNVAMAADKYGCSNFILISTDKAVNPTNIMGASKRLCELIIQAMALKSKTTYVAVRFGNVLGSNGSVIPLFKKQIAKGGPVTITHREIIRFFMTIEEAVALVLEAGFLAKGGEVFVLDMGEPVKIYDMACKLIKLSGYTPNVDIRIVETGLRPGEKLYEEILMNEEGLNKTLNSKIFIAKPKTNYEDSFFNEVEDFINIVYDENIDIKYLLQKFVPEYKPSIG